MLIRSREEPCHACSGASPAREACDRCGKRGVIYVPCAKTCQDCKGVRGVTCQRCDSWGFVPDYGFEFSAGGAVAVAPAALPTPCSENIATVRSALRHAPQCSRLVAPCDCGCARAFEALHAIANVLRTKGAA